MATRSRIGFHVNRIAQAAIVAGILVAANVIANRWFARADLTERQEHTIAPATKKALAQLDDVVNVNAYFSRKLPPDIAVLRNRVRDLLEEYRAYSGGRMHLEFIDPGDDPVMQQKLRALGIPPLQLQVLERDQFQITTVHLGLALFYGGKKEVLPVIQDTEGLEYELTASLMRLTSPERKAVGWLDGGAEEGFRDPREGRNPLREELGKLYSVQELRPALLDRVPDSVSTLVVESPQGLAEPARFALDQFLMRGGRAVFLVDHFSLVEGTLSPVPVESGVHDLLENYGVKVRRDIVAEPEMNALAAFSSGFMQFRIPYPYWARVTRDTLDPEHPITGKIESLVLPWASSLEVALPAGAAVKASVLAKSTPDAWTETGAYDFSPQPRRESTATRGPAGEQPLIVLLTGRFPSFWTSKAPPAPADGQTVPAVIKESAETAILVVGTSRLAQRDFLRQFPEDGAFLLNAVDWMTMGQDLIGIRSRVASERVLRSVPEHVKSTLKALNVVVVPLLIAIFGLVRLNLRRRRKGDDA